VWDAGDGEELLVMRGHERSVEAAAFSPDGAQIVTGAWDSTIRLWDAASGEELLVLRGHEDVVSAAGFSPDGARIVSGSGDGTIRVTWIPESKEELIETARARLPRELTEQEKRRYHLTND
jgi:WD40 repeat protein